MKQLFGTAKNQRLGTFGVDTDKLDVRKIQIIDPNPFDLNDLSIGAERAIPDVEMPAPSELPRH